ncbi:MAG: hypothetical protein KDJ40_20905 [Hyphomicrobiales bacterium]|nr:hypothetical protein [Hyphomicrobiales bacterium]
MFQRISHVRKNLLRLSLAGALACVLATPAFAEDKPAPAAAPAAAAPAAAPEQKVAAKKKRRKARVAKPSGRTGLARVSGSLEQRHQVCLAFIRRHNLDCDPWQTPTCGAETGYFRPPECVRPRSQQ